MREGKLCEREQVGQRDGQERRKAARLKRRSAKEQMDPNSRRVYLDSLPRAGTYLVGRDSGRLVARVRQNRRPSVATASIDRLDLSQRTTRQRCLALNRLWLVFRRRPVVYSERKRPLKIRAQWMRLLDIVSPFFLSSLCALYTVLCRELAAPSKLPLVAVPLSSLAIVFSPVSLSLCCDVQLFFFRLSLFSITFYVFPLFFLFLSLTRF